MFFLTGFLAVLSKRTQMDKGLRIGRWGQLQGQLFQSSLTTWLTAGPFLEWKVDMDSPTDTHRHLSHLIGVSELGPSCVTQLEKKLQLYPGYAITSYDSALQGGLIVDGTFLNYTKEQVLAAAETSLLHRGNGTSPDADSGWQKVWRAAGWAQLGHEREYYKVLTVCVQLVFILIS